jgi:hypothetical protein
VGESRERNRFATVGWAEPTDLTTPGTVGFTHPTIGHSTRAEYIGQRRAAPSGQQIRALSQVKTVVKSRCHRRKLLPRNDFSVVRARSTAFAAPPGKKSGWEHQDLRRRHLLKSQIVNVPRTPISAVARPLEKHSTLV